MLIKLAAEMNWLARSIFGSVECITGTRPFVVDALHVLVLNENASGRRRAASDFNSLLNRIYQRFTVLKTH